MPRKWRGHRRDSRQRPGLREEYAAFDAERRFDVDGITAEEPAECIAGAGAARPQEAARVPRLRPPLHARTIRWAPRWSPRKGPVRPIFVIGGEGRGIEGLGSLAAMRIRNLRISYND